MKFELGSVEVQKAGRLPHWQIQHGIYFVTFNLHDALPRAVRFRIQQEATAQIAHIEFLRGQLTIAEKRSIDFWVRSQMGTALDDQYGTCMLRDPRVAQIVVETITRFDDRRYSLLAWCVMPNHLHIVFTLRPNDRLDRVLHSWKSFTAKAANRLLGREGPFWQEGYYDRTIRDSEELSRTIEYVLANPAKAGLTDWPFVRVYPDRVAALVSPGGTPGDLRAGRPPH